MLNFKRHGIAKGNFKYYDLDEEKKKAIFPLLR
jgi:hypothetical protein